MGTIADIIARFSMPFTAKPLPARRENYEQCASDPRPVLEEIAIPADR